MSTTITYKGQTLATVSNDTKTLLTEGKYLEDDITLVDVSGGGAVLTTKNISANGTYNASSDSADGYSQVNVAVPASAVDTGTKNITANGNGQDVVGYAAVNVNVPNTYSAGDEGKVVSNGALVAQTSDTVTTNDTYDTTLINSLTVNVSGGGGSPLPAGYTQYEYIESSGTQYIDTGLYTKSNQRYYIQFRCGSGGINVCGNNLSTGCGLFIQSNSATVYCRFGSNNYYQPPALPYTNDGLALLRDFALDIDGFYLKDYLPEDYTLFKGQTGSSVTEDSTIHNILFGRTTGANARQLSAVKIYRFRCKEGDSFVRDMYPAMRNADSVLGMYDVVNDVFYTNAGSGTFTGGAMS